MRTLEASPASEPDTRQHALPCTNLQALETSGFVRLNWRVSIPVPANLGRAKVTSLGALRAEAGSRDCGVRLLPHLLMGRHGHVSSPWKNGLPTAYLGRLLWGVCEEVVPPASHSWDMLSAHQAASLTGKQHGRGTALPSQLRGIR